MNSVRWLNNKNQWGIISVVIHWLSALMIFALFGLGLWMVGLEYYDAWYRKAPYYHKSTGILLLLITILRLIWLQINSRPEVPVGYTVSELKIAKIMHSVLYVLLITIMLSGYFISTADGRAVVVFNWFEVPATLTGIDNQEDKAGFIHFWLAASMMCLVIVHAMAAIKHHFFDRDKSLKRMLGL